jgi:hypothetical protein
MVKGKTRHLARQKIPHSYKMGICSSQVIPESCGPGSLGFAEHLTMELYGSGPVATAC